MQTEDAYSRPGFNQSYEVPLRPSERRLEALLIVLITAFTALLLRS